MIMKCLNSRNNYSVRMLIIEIVAMLAAVQVADAIWSPWLQSGEEEAVSLLKLENYWLDAIDVVSDLDSYDTLWIKPHSCVWSECAVDDTDDGYMGDNRDGDEQWYQYRTQGFCANSAYSLYGQKKSDEFLSFLSGKCTQKHFINSFFTYGGADNLLLGIDESPVVYYGGNDNDKNDNDDGSGISLSENAVCYEVDEYSIIDDYFLNKYDNDGNDDDDNSNSGDNSNDYDGYTQTLGCGHNGEYIIGTFRSGSCDGNYFAGVVDRFEDYNEQHDSIGCHKVYEKDDEVSVENVMILLNNSWTCDLRLYPDGCPDPFGLKEKYDFAMRTVIHGGNAQRAYRTMTVQKPLHIASWTLLGITISIFIFSYMLKNRRRAFEKQSPSSTSKEDADGFLVDSDNNKITKKQMLVGYAKCVGEDIVTSWRMFCEWMVIHWKKFCAWIAMLCAAFVAWFMFKIGMKTNDDTTTSEQKDEREEDLVKKTSKDKIEDADTDSDDSYVKETDNYVPPPSPCKNDEDIEAVVVGEDAGGISLQGSITGSLATAPSNVGGGDTGSKNTNNDCGDDFVRVDEAVP